MATRSKKPKCDGSTSQSCGMGCISREHTCRELIAADVATRLLSVAKQHQQPNDASGQSFDTIAANFPASVLKAAHKTGVATKDLGNGAVLTTKVAVGLDGSSIKYGFVTDVDGKRYTVSDGLVKEVTSAVGSEWGEAFDAAVRSKVANSAAVYAYQIKEEIDYQLVDKYATNWDIPKGSLREAKIGNEVGHPPGGQGLALWLSEAYLKLSEYSYKDINKLRASDDYSKSKEDSFRSAVQALKLLKPFDFEDVNSSDFVLSGKQPPIDSSRMSKLNRFVKLNSNDIAKYQVGSTVTEQGMFATSYLDAKEFDLFSEGANVNYIVKSKGLGKTGAKAMDRLNEGSQFAGELLFTPGTKFKVSKVEVAKPLPLFKQGKNRFADLDDDELISEMTKANPNTLISGVGTVAEALQMIKKGDYGKLKQVLEKSDYTGYGLSDLGRSKINDMLDLPKQYMNSYDVSKVDLHSDSQDSAILLDFAKTKYPSLAKKIDDFISKKLNVNDSELKDVFKVNQGGKLQLSDSLTIDTLALGQTKIYLEEL